ncbi:MAG: nuclear transport factor 2 family protein [Anaerolineae bacterium]|nr:nuclear transport factor 2 family protein [Anaerolineae bacterium]
MKTRLITIATLVLVLALPVALYAQETDPASVVTALYEACNAGDVDAALALFTDDAVVKLVPALPPGSPDTYTGKEELRAWLEGLVAMNWEGEFEILQVEGDTVTTRLTSWADPTREIGIAPLVATEVYTVQDGKIKGFTWTLSDESLAKVQAALAALPVTGGAAPSIYSSALLMALGGLAILVGLGLALLRRRSLQQG